ncbi:Aste57867_24929 [Aphanomyces stellatus]|uniref:Aste57867_24929 protein n=1 Tax=Aphanomyces stellatus TaxID=120398 RepID=A0A485LRS4_9STRA|nr:hypothetical protein As57867_024851 [Aphanomyces stellatus]VFU01561.1 Aste57867_24929 [Aphanomyces stellatus]
MQVVAVPDPRFYDTKEVIAERFRDADIVLRSLRDWDTAVFRRSVLLATESRIYIRKLSGDIVRHIFAKAISSSRPMVRDFRGYARMLIDEVKHALLFCSTMIQITPSARSFICSHSDQVKATMPVEAIIFDLDGTLMDTEMLSVETLIEVAGPRFSIDLHKRIRGMPDHQWTRIVIDELELTHITPEELAHEWFVGFTDKYAKSALMPGALELIMSLQSKPVKVGLATSSKTHDVEAKRAVHPTLFAGFEVIVCGDDPAVVNGKPSPDIFLAAAARLGIQDVSACVVVEDSPAGVAAGRAAGMQVVAVPESRFYDTDEVIAETFREADIILRSLHDWDMTVFR